MSVCGTNLSLFQLEVDEEHIRSWLPLSCSSDDPKNCGATTLAISKILPIYRAQMISRETEHTGIAFTNLGKIVSENSERLNIVSSPYIPIQNIYEVLTNQLLPGNLTIIAIWKEIGKTGHMGHATTILKANDGTVILFEGQYMTAYWGTELDTYFAQYKFFACWCSKILLKRKYDDIISMIRKKPITDQPAKRSRSFGGKRRRHKNKRGKTVRKK